MWSAPARRSAVATPARSSSAAAAKRSRSRAARCRPRAARPSRGRRARAGRRAPGAPRAGRGSRRRSTRWRAPSARSARCQSSVAAEVRDDDDEPRLAREAPDAVQHRRDAAVGDAVDGDALLEQLAQPELRVRAAARRQHPLGPPAVKTASRPPWRVAARATTCATPSATSDFSRSAVPNAIDAETSSTSQVVRIRSGTCRRTCAMPGARAGGGIELADVVAELVGAQLRELGAAADAGREAVAGQHAGAAPRERQRERVDERSRDRPRPLARGRHVQRRRRQSVRSGGASCSAGSGVGAAVGERAEDADEDVVGASRRPTARRRTARCDGAGRRRRGRARRRTARGGGRAAARARAPPGPSRSRRAGSRRTG